MWWYKDYYAPAVGKGAISVAFVRLSVVYIVNNSRTQRPSVHKFGRNVPYLWCDSHTSLKIKRSKVKVISPIYMLTYIVGHILQTARPTNFKLSLNGTRMEEDDPHQPQVPWPPRLKVARSRDQSEPSWPNAVGLPVSLEAGGGIPCRPNLAATLLDRYTDCRIAYIYRSVKTECMCKNNINLSKLSRSSDSSYTNVPCQCHSHSVAYGGW